MYCEFLTHKKDKQEKFNQISFICVYGDFHHPGHDMTFVFAFCNYIE